MMTSWMAWKPFPIAGHGARLDAPNGPGLYEVRHMDTGALVAFGHCGDVARDLNSLLNPPTGLRAWFDSKPKLTHRTDELEYRTCAASSALEAKTAAERLRSRREAFWRTRLVTNWT